MSRDYGMEIDALVKEVAELKKFSASLVQQIAGTKETMKFGETGKSETSDGESDDAGSHGGDDWNDPDNVEEDRKGTTVEIIKGMHPDQRLGNMMEEMCRKADSQRLTGLVSYLGVFSSGGRQSNWIHKDVNTGDLLALIEDHTAEKVLSCIGNNDRLNILLAILKKPMSVAEIVAECGLGSTGQAYHHMKPLLAADLITEDSGNAGKGIYIVQPHKVQGIIMLLVGIADMVDETYTKGNWEKEI